METSVSNNTRIFSVLRCIFVGANTVVCFSFSGLSSEFRNAKSTEKPPLPKVHVTKKPMQPKQSDTTKKASAKSSKVNKFIFVIHRRNSYAFRMVVQLYPELEL
jgi:hypothetical protein